MKFNFTIFALLLFAAFTNAQTPVTAVNTSNAAASSGFTYTNAGKNYYWGTAPNNTQVYLDGFTAGGLGYTYANSLTGSVKLRRVDNANVTGNFTLVYAEAVNTSSDYYMFPEYQNNMEDILNNHFYNKGTDNLFDNTSSNSNNIERLDWLLASSYSTSTPEKVGFAVFERGADNQHDAFCIAAVTAVDGLGNPSAYGSIVRVATYNYGNVGPQFTYNILKAQVPSNLLFSANQTQSRGGVFVSLQDLGITTGQTIYGYSLFSADLPSSATPADLVDYTNATYFPTNTDNTGGIDLLAITGTYIENSIAPTRFVSFNASENQDKVSLKWNVENETSVDHYIVERSTDGQAFSQIGKIHATSNSTGANSYSYEDNILGVSGNQIYYRIRQYDHNGNYYFSKTVLLRRNQKSDGLIIYPNPVRENLNLNVTSSSNQWVTILVSNAKGQQLIKEKMNLSEGNNAITINKVDKLTPGIYQLVLINNNGSKEVKSFVKE